MKKLMRIVYSADDVIDYVDSEFPKVRWAVFNFEGKIHYFVHGSSMNKDIKALLEALKNLGWN